MSTLSHTIAAEHAGIKVITTTRTGGNITTNERTCDCGQKLPWAPDAAAIAHTLHVIEATEKATREHIARGIETTEPPYGWNRTTPKKWAASIARGQA